MRGLVDWAAVAATEVLTPGVTVIGFSLLCGLYGTQNFSGLWWGLALGMFCGAVPYTVLLMAARAKRISDKHVTQRRDRPWAYMVCLASVVCGFVTMLTLDAPALLIWGIVTMAAGLVVAAAVTAVGPKVSMHAFCLTALGVLAAFLISPWCLIALAALLPLVVWSRLHLGHHSPVEVATGTALGAAVLLVAWVFAP